MVIEVKIVYLNFNKNLDKALNNSGYGMAWREYRKKKNVLKVLNQRGVNIYQPPNNKWIRWISGLLRNWYRYLFKS